jgi:hypothetical protein
LLLIVYPSIQGRSIKDASEEGPRIAWFRESRESGYPKFAGHYTKKVDAVENTAR